MSSAAPPRGDIYHEIASGIACASQALHAAAVQHFRAARSQIGAAHGALCEALDDYIVSHERYWQAQQDLNQASVKFSHAHSQQAAELTRLSSLLERAVGEPPATRPAARAAARGPGGLPELAVTCFGRFQVLRGGEPLQLCASRSGRALLRFLATQPGRQASADALMDAFWPDDTPDVARHKLHVAASAIRAALNEGLEVDKGGGYLRREDSTYRIAEDAAVRVDVDDFVAAYTLGRRSPPAEAAGHFARACQLYRGPFLTEDRYADWSMIRREQLAHMFLTMCEALAERALEERRYDDAVHWATSILGESPCEEGAYRALIRAHAGAGRRAEALRQLQRCERVLREELGVEPSPETRAAARPPSD